MPLVALPGYDLSLTGSVSMTNEDDEYPAENIQDGDPANVAKSTTNTTTFTITTASSSIVAAAAINTNAETVTVNAQSLTVPALDNDGQRIHGWLDRRTVPLGPTTTWTIVLTRSTGVVWVGAIPLLEQIEELPLKYGLQMGRNRPGDEIIRTRLGSLIKHGQTIRTRWARGSVWDESPSLLDQLEASSQGPILSFVFIPNEDVNDAWYVAFDTDDYAVSYHTIDHQEIGFRVTELSGGPPNG
jgi:hypothetical protein